MTQEQEFTNLIQDHKRIIYTVCYMFSKNKEVVDDMFQEILIRLWQGLDSFEGRSSVQTWIYRIALNTAINRRRIETIPLSVDIDPYEADNPAT